MYIGSIDEKSPYVYTSVFLDWRNFYARHKVCMSRVIGDDSKCGTSKNPHSLWPWVPSIVGRKAPNEQSNKTKSLIITRLFRSVGPMFWSNSKYCPGEGYCPLIITYYILFLTSHRAWTIFKEKCWIILLISTKIEYNEFCILKHHSSAWYIDKTATNNQSNITVKKFANEPKI